MAFHRSHSRSTVPDHLRLRQSDRYTRLPTQSSLVIQFRAARRSDVLPLLSTYQRYPVDEEMWHRLSV